SPIAVAPKANIFLTLTDDEAASVISFLHNQTELNLTSATEAGTWDNSIEMVDLVQPNKTDALEYLDNGGPVPDRFATARVAFGATEEPYVQEFAVGPLPISNASTYASLDWLTTSGSAKIRNYNAGVSFQIVADIILDLLNGTATGSDDDDFDIWGIDPLWREEIDGEEHIILWNTYWRYPSGKDALFDGKPFCPRFVFKSDITGRDSSKWKVLGWIYGDIFYPTIEAFREAWSSPGSVKYELNFPGSWIASDQVRDFLPGDNMAPPVTIQPNGLWFVNVYRHDRRCWLVTFTRDTGVRLFDIKYRGQRIIYELGLQEAVAHYAGNDPVQNGTAYLDTLYGFGPYAFELLPGYDCPTYSKCESFPLLNATFHAAEISTTHRNNICLFESDAGYPMQRHSTSKYLVLTKNIVFTLRSVSTVGSKYLYSDSMIASHFALDGSIETIVRASGYIQAAYYAKNNDYGYQIHDALSGSMHDHSLNWKVIQLNLYILRPQTYFV
ncbi:copper amine oxidase, partial [Mycena vulgaris]